uniref:GB1/RHD3-type G domain-containing protein n=1 Tax=Rhabditophanes sp. KR3021 TaxID=114890 RepID=A0AC35U8V1_9BILA
MEEERKSEVIELTDTVKEETIVGEGPIRIIETTTNNEYALNLNSLEKLLMDPEYADKKVVVVSVAGAYRKGKSFLLNFFIRYLKAKEVGVEERTTDKWIDTDDDLTGFSWKGGSVRDTTGILIWSKLFVLKDKNNEDIVVILMDTQGSFDSNSTVKDNATIFALSTMVSATQIYNISQNIQEDDLDHLGLFTEYGKLAMEDSDVKPFQSLMFLVRDWSYPYEAEYGLDGGKRILEARLETNEKQHVELRKVREHIHSCFEKLECYLMPHPGLNVSTNPNFKGKLSGIENEFKSKLETFVEYLFDSHNLVPKKINGSNLTCRHLFEYFKAYIQIFKGETLPEPKNMLLATAEANNFAAVSQAKAIYTKEMEEICGGATPYIQTEELEKEHERVKNNAIRIFKNIKKMGGSEYSLSFLEKLEEDILTQWECYLKVNASKNLFKSMRTPAVLVALLFINYIFQEFFQLIGIEIFASFFSAIIFVIITSLSVWTYSRYSGNIREMGQGVDDGVLWLWDNFLSPVSQQGIHSATEFTVKLNTTSSINKKHN